MRVRSFISSRANVLVADELRQEPVPRREVLREAGEAVGRRLEGVDHGEELPLPLGVAEERRDEPLALAGPLLDGAEDLPERGHRRPPAPPSRGRRAPRRRRGGRRAPSRCGRPRGGRSSRRSSAGASCDSSFPCGVALVSSPTNPSPFSTRPEDRLERLGDGGDVVDEVSRAGEDLVELAPADRGDLRAGLRERLVGRARGHLEVLVAEEPDRLDLHPAVGPDEVAVAALDVEADGQVLARAVFGTSTSCTAPTVTPARRTWFPPMSPWEFGKRAK